MIVIDMYAVLKEVETSAEKKRRQREREKLSSDTTCGAYVEIKGFVRGRPDDRKAATLQNCSCSSGFEDDRVSV